MSDCLLLSSAGYSSAECSWSSYHLPSSIVPTQYNLELSTELQEPFLVVGAVTVLANVTRPSKCIVLHALDMNITHMNRLDPHTHGRALAPKMSAPAGNVIVGLTNKGAVQLNSDTTPRMPCRSSAM